MAGDPRVEPVDARKSGSGSPRLLSPSVCEPGTGEGPRASRTSQLSPPRAQRPTRRFPDPPHLTKACSPGVPSTRRRPLPSLVLTMLLACWALDRKGTGCIAEMAGTDVAWPIGARDQIAETTRAVPPICIVGFRVGERAASARRTELLTDSHRPRSIVRIAPRARHNSSSFETDSGAQGRTTTTRFSPTAISGIRGAICPRSPGQRASFRPRLPSRWRFLVGQLWRWGSHNAHWTLRFICRRVDGRDRSRRAPAAWILAWERVIPRIASADLNDEQRGRRHDRPDGLDLPDSPASSAGGRRTAADLRRLPMRRRSCRASRRRTQDLSQSGGGRCAIFPSRCHRSPPHICAGCLLRPTQTLSASSSHLGPEADEQSFSGLTARRRGRLLAQ